jgi:rhodanese-related sulfurtransferase
MQTVSKSDVKKAIEGNQDVLLIDVLPEDSFRERHIPGSINIPFNNNERFADQVNNRVKSKDTRVIVYCASATCDLSSKAARKLTEAGFTSVAAYEEGVEGWFGNKQQAA